MLAEKAVAAAGQQLCVLLGFRTSGTSREAGRAWREWTGITPLYRALSRQPDIQVTELLSSSAVYRGLQVHRVEYLECQTAARELFHHLVLLFLQAASKLPVLDTVHRFCSNRSHRSETEMRSRSAPLLRLIGEKTGDI